MWQKRNVVSWVLRFLNGLSLHFSDAYVFLCNIQKFLLYLVGVIGGIIQSCSRAGSPGEILDYKLTVFATQISFHLISFGKLCFFRDVLSKLSNSLA